MSFRAFRAGLALALVGACAAPPAADAPAAPAAAAARAPGAGLAALRADPPRRGEDVLFEHARVWTDAEAPEPAQALLVRGGRVLAAGDAAALAARAPGARRVDLAGAVVVPGLSDAHGHVEALGERLETLDLDGCASYAELVERARAAAAALPPGAWLVGRGWDQTRWPESAFPEHGPLSRAVPDRPVFLERVDGHAALVNERALALAGLDRGAPPPVEGGRVLVGADGRASGVLVDRAMELVERLRPPPDRATLRRRLLLAQDALLAAGLVCVHDMGLRPATVRELLALEAEGRWKLRVIGYVWASDGFPAELALHPDAHDRDPTSRVRIVGAKLMLDGALGSRGAALLEDYADAPGQRGHLLAEPERFRALLDDVADRGLQPAVHAIGDRANRVLLDAYEARLARDPGFARLRPRVEHAQVVAPEDRGRFEALGVVRSMQPTHATSDMRWAEARLGPERVRGAYAWRRLAPDPAAIALGSDFPVERHQPLEGLYAAIARRDREGQPPGGWQPDQALRAREALAGFTSAPAFAAGEERLRGRLAPGCAADFVVLDADPLAGPPEALLSARVLCTAIEGEVVAGP